MTWNIDYPKKKERNKERKQQQQQQQQQISNRHLYSIKQSTKTNIVIIKMQLFTNKDTAKYIYIYIYIYNIIS